MDEVRKLGALKGAEIRYAKEVLAYEATKLCHGEEEAEKARKAAKQLFGGSTAEISDSVPTFAVMTRELDQGIPAYLLFERAGLCETRSEARRLISQGGGYINNTKIEAFDQVVDMDNMVDDSILLRAGKKRYTRITAQ